MSETARPASTSWPKYALPFDTTINGYRIERVLGSGGFGVTYLARDLLGQLFAIKEYFPRQFAIREALSVVAASAEDTALFDECRDRFLREAQALVLLGRRARADDGIVRVQTYFEAYGTCFMVMDYVEGVSLATVLQTAPGGLAPERVDELLAQLLSSLRAVHQAGLMHRDIKPANIILTDAGRAVLIDFGSSREAATDLNTAYTQIYSGGYAPPEQMLGLPQGEFSDIYAVGAVCYQAIGGKVSDALLRQNMAAAGRPDPQPSAQTVGAGRYAGSLLMAIDAALSVDPAARPPNVDAMLALVRPEEAVDTSTVIVSSKSATVAPSVGPAITSPVSDTPAKAPPKSRLGLFAAAGAAGVLALGAAGYFLVWRGAAPPPAPVAVSRPPPAEVAVADSWDPAAPKTGDQPAPRTGDQPAPRTGDQPAPPPVTERAAKPLPDPPANDEALREARLERQLERVPVMERAREAAETLSCSVVTVKRGANGTRLSGLAPAGDELDRLLVKMRDLGNPADEITRVDRSTCGMITTMAHLVLQSWDSVPRTLTIQPIQHVAASNARSRIEIESALPTLIVDVYDEAGSVHHLAHPVHAGAFGKFHTDWVASGAPGQRLIVAIASVAPLDLGSRPATEHADEYLEVLRARIESGAIEMTADMTSVTIPHAAGR